MSNRFKPVIVVACLFGTAFLSSCKSTGGGGSGGGGVTSAPKWNPSSTTNIMGSSATPPHNLPRSEYPFDAKGNYISSWVAEGAGKYGHSTSARSSASHSYSKPKSSSSSTKKSSSSSYRYHKVAAGDTLYGLSRRYGTSVSKIKSANGLSSDTIVNGRTLKIPK